MRLPRRRDGDRGAALVEFILTFPVLFLLLSGIFEFGLMYRDYSLAGDAVRDAARIGAIQGPKSREIDGATVSPDYSIVAAARAGLGGMQMDAIDRVVVFRGNPPSFGSALAQVPAVCKTSSTSSTGANCNVYPASEAFEAIQNGDTDYFRCIEGAGRACGWPASDRNDGPQPTEIDYLGVYLKIERPYLTGLFGDELTLELASLLRLEPGSVEDP